LAYQPLASNTFLSQQTSHQQPANNTFLSEQTSTSHQPPAKRTGCKILVERLQQVIISLIHANHYVFIKSRTNQDCLAWAFEYIHLCKSYKKEVVILKLDFEKAFDKIEHQAILQIMRHKGFRNIWISWVKCILEPGTSYVLLNGVPGKVFHCKRGVRQGDPLSPLLFVLATDLLQSLVNQALH
jgi:hypothetical protein